MELYTTSTKGKLEELRSIHNNKKYPLVEEVSKAGYYWTVFHYASHYGHTDVLEYLIDKYDVNEDKFEIFNLQTVEG